MSVSINQSGVIAITAVLKKDFQLAAAALRFAVKHADLSEEQKEEYTAAAKRYWYRAEAIPDDAKQYGARSLQAKIAQQDKQQKRVEEELCNDCRSAVNRRIRHCCTNHHRKDSHGYV